MPEQVERARGAGGWREAGKWPLIVLGVLIVAGVAIRVLAAISWWPISTTLADSWPYARYALVDPFADPQHPAGYSLMLAGVGVFTRDIGFFGVLQGLMGIASGVILFAGVRRLCGSPWPGVVGAGVILLGADQIYLERSIMSETWFTLLLVATIYAIARALESPDRWYPWPPVAGALAALAGITRPAGLVLVPLLFVGLVAVRPRPWLPRWRPLVAFVVPVCAGVLAFASANDISHGRFEIGPTPGWHLYSRVAPIADCDQFTPPEGTRSLCQSIGREQRLGPDWYLYAEKSPATELFGGLGITGGTGDSKLEAFAIQAILHDPRAYVESVWPDIKAYFFSDDYVYKLGRGTDLDGQLDWSREWDPESTLVTQQGMEEFFDPFSVHQNRGDLLFLHDYQRQFRFGATALTIATLLTILGMFVGTRRSRIAVLILGVGALAMLILPTFSVGYSGRYTVPLAGPLAAAAIVAAMAAWERLRLFRATGKTPPRAA